VNRLKPRSVLHTHTGRNWRGLLYEKLWIKQNKPSILRRDSLWWNECSRSETIYTIQYTHAHNAFTPKYSESLYECIYLISEPVRACLIFGSMVWILKILTCTVYISIYSVRVYFLVKREMVVVRMCRGNGWSFGQMIEWLADLALFNPLRVYPSAVAYLYHMARANCSDCWGESCSLVEISGLQRVLIQLPVCCKWIDSSTPQLHPYF